MVTTRFEARHRPIAWNAENAEGSCVSCKSHTIRFAASLKRKFRKLRDLTNREAPVAHETRKGRRRYRTNNTDWQPVHRSQVSRNQLTSTHCHIFLIHEEPGQCDSYCTPSSGCCVSWNRNTQQHIHYVNYVSNLHCALVVDIEVFVQTLVMEELHDCESQ